MIANPGTTYETTKLIAVNSVHRLFDYIYILHLVILQTLLSKATYNWGYM